MLTVALVVAAVVLAGIGTVLAWQGHVDAEQQRAYAREDVDQALREVFSGRCLPHAVPHPRSKES